MVEASIPVDLLNPGQVFACLGFMEAADGLIGDAGGRFDWSDEGKVRFVLRVAGELNPFEAVLEFLAKAEVKALAPPSWRPKEKPKKEPKNEEEKEKKKRENERIKLERELAELIRTDFMPSRAPETMAALPLQLQGIYEGRERKAVLTHWADSKAGRNDFKLYAGNRSALSIATAMLTGIRTDPRGEQNMGELETKGVMQLWGEYKEALIKVPFDVLTPMGGSFNFDPRGAWTAIDAGYSPNEHKHAIEASPVVEFLAAWGLENARPVEFGLRQVRYAAWGVNLPLILARAALAGALPAVPSRQFRFELDLSGKNKVVTFAQEEPHAIAHG